MKIAVFGGAFDPPHFGHIKVVRNFLKLGLVDEVWLLPVKSHAFSKKMAGAIDRLEMLALVKNTYFNDLPVQICEYELNQPGMSITYHTLQALSQKYPDHEFSFLMGSDNLINFHKWHFYEKMLKEFVFYVYPRSGFDFTLLREGMKALSNLEEMEISSTFVKNELLAGSEIDKLVAPEVIHYLSKHSLYST